MVPQMAKAIEQFLLPKILFSAGAWTRLPWCLGLAFLFTIVADSQAFSEEVATEVVAALRASTIKGRKVTVRPAE